MARMPHHQRSWGSPVVLRSDSHARCRGWKAFARAVSASIETHDAGAARSLRVAPYCGKTAVTTSLLDETDTARFGFTQDNPVDQATTDGTYATQTHHRR